MFRDRSDAGKQLAEALQKYESHPDAIVLALPRGGIVPGYEIANRLHLPLHVTCSKKIGAPGNPEYAIGVVSDTGKVLLDDSAIQALSISPDYLAAAAEEAHAKVRRYMQAFYEVVPREPLIGKIALIVDDGLATGMTMKAAIDSLRDEGVAKIVVAIPLAPHDTLAKIEALADEVVCLETPVPFYAVGQGYRDFTAVRSEEVIALLEKAQNK